MLTVPLPVRPVPVAATAAPAAPVALAVMAATPASLVGSAERASTAMEVMAGPVVLREPEAMAATAPLVTPALLMAETAEPAGIPAWSPASAERAALRVLAALVDGREPPAPVAASVCSAATVAMEVRATAP